MTFKVKDLMINIAPGEGARDAAREWCTPAFSIGGCGVTGCNGSHRTFLLALAEGAVAPAYCGAGASAHSAYPCGCMCTYGCTVASGGTRTYFMVFTGTICPFGTAIGPVPVPVGGDPAPLTEQLAALKTQLTQAVAEIERQQAAVDESLKPQTVAQVEELQAKMQEALAELDRRKQELSAKK